MTKSQMQRDSASIETQFFHFDFKLVNSILYWPNQVNSGNKHLECWIIIAYELSLNQVDSETIQS